MSNLDPDEGEAFSQYLAERNEDDRDIGELDEVSGEQVERWYENWETDGQPGLRESSSKVVNGRMEYRSFTEEEWQVSQPWKLGKEGKGLIINDVPHIWSVDYEGEPHHSQICSYNYLWVVISPTGEVDGEDESVEQFFENCHPDLHAKSPNSPDNPWTFSKVANDIVEQAYQAAQGGGITIKLDGTIPPSGYAFSPFKGQEEIVPTPNLKPDHIDKYINEHRQQLNDPQNYLGIWVNGPSTYIDVTQVLDDFDEAYRLAWDAEQEAMWDIVQEKEIPVREGGLPPITSASWPVVTKFVYNIPTNHLVIGKTAKEEGEVESHADLLKHAQLEPKNNIYGQFDPSGRAVSLGRPRIEGFGKSEMTPYEAEYRAKQAIESAVPGVAMKAFEPSHDRWNIDSPKVTYVHEPPVVDKQAEPSSDDWVFSRVARHRIIPEAIEEMRNRHGLQNQVRVLPMPQGRDPRAGYAGVDRDPMTGKPSHRIYLKYDTPIGAANWALHHELGHALQTERDGYSADTTGLSDEEYKNSPREKEAEELAGQHADLPLLK
jgi:hypothetical protein